MKVTTISGILAIILLLHSVSVRASQPTGTQDTPNFVIIIADDLGYSDIGCYGSEIHTPVLDNLASNGLRFTQFYNCGRCWPTRSSLLTGYYPQQVNNDGARAEFPLWGYLLPHHLKQAGYRCYHSGKWHVPNVTTQLEEGGFDRSYHTGGYNSHFAANNHFLDDKKLPPAGQESNYYSTNIITDHAVQFLKEHQQKHAQTPFFLYTAFITPHFPLQASQEDIDRYRDRYLDGWEKLKRERYKRQQEHGFRLGENSAFEYHVTAPWSCSEEWLKDTIPGEIRLARPWDQLNNEEKYLQATKMAIHAAMVDRIDREIGRIMDQLKAMGELENTLVLFLSDNGASAEQIVRGNGHDRNVPLGAGDSYLCLGPGFSTASNTPFRRHKYWTHEGGIATPLIAHWPKGIKTKGEFRHAMGHVVDFLPTFLELAEVDELKERNGHQAPELPGRSLIPVFKNDQPVHQELYFEHSGNRALRQGKWKAVISSAIDGRWQLYDMEKDRTEITNLADEFFNMKNSPVDKMNRQRLGKMIKRWEELDSLYLKQGKAGLTKTN
ncbi:MAG: arylsulfatase [Mariniphaga sp.]